MIYSLLDQYTLLSSSNVIFEGFTEFSCLAIIVSSSYYSDFGLYLAGLNEGMHSCCNCYTWKRSKILYTFYWNSISYSCAEHFHCVKLFN